VIVVLVFCMLGAKKIVLAEDPKCPIAINKCNMQNGWDVKGLTDAQKTFDVCPPCECGPIPEYERDTCKGKRKLVNASTLNFINKVARYWVIESKNFCIEGKVAELYGDPGLSDDTPCRCIDEKAYHSDDYVGDGNMINDPGTTGSVGNGKNVTINGVGTTLFCTDPVTGKLDSINPEVMTAIGCIPVSIGGFISWIIPNLMGVVGGISFLIMVYGFIMIATSEGDPKKAQAAKETITAAITGLILSIFAIFLVRLIMLYVLRLPGVR